MGRHGNLQKHLNSNPLQRILLQRFHEKVAYLIRQTGRCHLLDVGCGEGFVLKYLRRQENGLVLTGGDFNPEGLIWGRDNTGHCVPLVNFDIHQLPYADNTFPLVMCLEVLEHLPDSRIGLQELVRVSSDYVLLSVPHEPWFRGSNFLRGKNIPNFGNDPEHLHNYTGRGFRQMVAQMVEIIWHGYVFPWQIILGRKQK
jgi:SAM-dependent methyltransferase